MPVADGVEVDFINAGHLLGSSYARVRAGGTTILFGGDLGRFGRPVLPDPTMVEEADYLLVESTYGNRVHEKDDDGEQLAQAIKATAERGGKVIIPAFAVGRVEELLYWIKRLEEEKRIPVLPVFVDSPMATEALSRYTERVRELDPELQPEERDEKAPHGHGRSCATRRAERREHARRERQLCVFCTERFRTIASPQESQGADGVEDAGDRHLVERHGDRRPRAASPEGGAARPAEHGAARRASRPPAPAAAQLADGAHGGQDPRADRSPCTPASKRSTRCRPTPTPRRSCAGSAASRARRARPSSCTASSSRWKRSRRRSRRKLGWNTKMPQHEETVELA